MRRVVFAAGLLILATGCLQVDTVIKLHEDGSATITERLQFSRALLDLEKNQGADLRLGPLLEKSGALERMKHMGKGVRLVSHKVQEGKNGARESIAVFRVDDLNSFRYVSPFAAYTDYAKNNVVAVRCQPVYKSSGSRGSTAGQMAVDLRPLRHPQREDRNKPAKGLTPRELQAWRELRHVVRDLLQGFKVRLRFECYAPIASTGFGLRGQRAGTRHVDLVNFSHTDLDRHGREFLRGEETMAELARLWLSGPNIAANTHEVFVENRTVPVFLVYGSRHCPHNHGTGIYFAPSRALFDRHFKGKKLDYARGRPSPPEKHVPATFKRIGYHPRKRSKKSP
jgi:hypothetical protein